METEQIEKIIDVEKISEIQQQVNKLVERRLQFLNEFEELNNEKEELKDKFESVKNEFEAIDELFRTKFNELKTLRGD